MVYDGGTSATRDDRTWPRYAIPMSAVLAAAALGLAIYIATAGDEAWPTAAAFLVGTMVGATLLIAAIRKWLSGGTIPQRLVVISGVIGIAAGILVLATGLAGAGGALSCGLMFGLMIGNIQAVRMARANRKASTS